MFCSVPPPPTTTAKSKSSWLNNLRSSKGFPDSDHTDLEHFLSSSQSCNPPDIIHNSPNILHKHHETVNTDRDSDSVNDILSELFCMGEFDNLSKVRSRRRKQSCRKQLSPRICLVSSNVNVNSVNENSDVRNKVVSVSKVRLSKPLTLTGRKKVKELKLKVRESVDKVEEDRGGWDASGYSQTEVTVIDTSDPLWKFDKVLYRRNNVWKVGDMKGRGLIVSVESNKRKVIVSEDENDDNVHKKKKKKKKKLKLSLCNSLSKVGDAEEDGEHKKKKKKKKKKLKLCNSSSYVDKEDDIVGSKSA